jgi:predicted acyl esterase
MASKPADARVTMEAAVPAYGIAAEKDVDVALRDGACLKADVLRPDTDRRFPAILNLGP